MILKNHVSFQFMFVSSIHNLNKLYEVNSFHYNAYLVTQTYGI